VIAMPCIARLLMIAIIRVATSALSLGEISEWTTAVRTFGHPKMGEVFPEQNLPPFAAEFDRLAFFKIYPAMHRTAAPSCELLSSKMLGTESSHTHRKAKYR